MTPFLQAAIAEMLDDAEATHGCDACKFSWEIDVDQALLLIHGSPERFAGLLDGRDGMQAPGRDVWSPSAYVWHVGDLVRAWSERLHTLANDPAAAWAGFDPDELADARGYSDLPQVTAAWALAQAVDALDAALAELDLEADFVHPEWGKGDVTDALRWLAHEVAHHELDVRRGLGLR
jgi:hypothetical protein